MDMLWSVLAGLAGGALLSAFSKSPSLPEQPLLQAPAPAAAIPPQEATKPNYSTALDKNKKRESAGPLAGAASTFLTGPLGVSPDKLKLGRNTLLGA